MSTQCFAAPLPRAGPSSWRTRLAALVGAWKAREQTQSARRIDAWFRREREAHERFLARAGDRYQLERMERDWERRHSDLWRVY